MGIPGKLIACLDALDCATDRGFFYRINDDPVKDKPGEPPTKKSVTDGGRYAALASLMRTSLRAKLDMSESEWDVVLKECSVVSDNGNWKRKCEAPGGVFNRYNVSVARLHTAYKLGDRRYINLGGPTKPYTRVEDQVKKDVLPPICRGDSASKFECAKRALKEEVRRQISRQAMNVAVSDAQIVPDHPTPIAQSSVKANRLFAEGGAKVKSAVRKHSDEVSKKPAATKQSIPTVSSEKQPSTDTQAKQKSAESIVNDALDALGKLDTNSEQQFDVFVEPGVPLQSQHLVNSAVSTPNAGLQEKKKLCKVAVSCGMDIQQLDSHKTMLILDELMKLQQILLREETGNAQVALPANTAIVLTGTRQEASTLVRIPQHKGNEQYRAAIKRNKTNYFSSLLEAMSQKTGGEYDLDQGAERLLIPLARDYPEVFVKVGRKYSLAMINQMDALGLASMMVDCGLKDYQTKLLLKHWRYALGENVAAPFHLAKKYSEGYIEPQVGEFEHQYENGQIELVKWEYQAVDKLFAMGLSEMVRQHHLKPKDVLELYFAVGGDHGRGAFRLTFKVILRDKDGNFFERVFGGSARVMCSKDRVECLEKSILPMLTADMERISKSKVVLRHEQDDDVTSDVVVELVQEDDVDFQFPEFVSEHNTGHVIDFVDMFNVGDIKWLAMILGMNGMASIWCIYCYLRKHQWNLQDHPLGAERTIENMMDYLVDTLTGADRMGVVGKAWWPFIKKCAIPLLHIIIGLFNDIDDHFLRRIEVDFAIKPEKELEAMAKLEAVVSEIALKKEELQDWEGGRLGEQLKELEKKQKTQNIYYENPEKMKPLAKTRFRPNLQVQVASPGYGGLWNATLISPAIDDEGNVAIRYKEEGGDEGDDDDGGGDDDDEPDMINFKMIKKAGWTEEEPPVMTAEDVANLHRLRSEKKGVANLTVLGEKKTVLEKEIEDHRIARKKDRNGVRMRLERVGRKHKMDRGRAFGGKYNGVVARKIMRHAQEVYSAFLSELKSMIREGLVKDDVDGLTELKEQVADLLEIWDKFFTLLCTKNPTEADKDTADELAKAAAKKHREVLKNLTPKAHIGEDHAARSFRELPSGLFRLLIEQWVEHNHQIGSRIENQYQGVVGLQEQFNGIASREHMAGNSEIRNRIKDVHDHNARGPYQKKEKRPAEDEVPQASPTRMPPPQSRQRVDVTE